MYGENKTTIEQLKNTVKELETLKIEIVLKFERTKELNNAIEKIENQIKQIDEKLLNNENISDEEMIFSEDSNLNILIDNINILTEQVIKEVSTEVERKDKQLKEEAFNNMLKGDFSYYAGTYELVYGRLTGKAETITLSKDGTISQPYIKINKNAIECYDDGMILLRDDSEFSTYIIPKGLNPKLYGVSGALQNAISENSNKDRMFFYGQGDGVYCKVY